MRWKNRRSYVDFIDLKTFEAEKSLPLFETNKFEGITSYKKDQNVLEFLICADTEHKKFRNYHIQIDI